MSASEAVTGNRMEETCSQIYEAATALFDPQQVVELRVLFTGGRVDSGYFSDHRLMAESASLYDQNNEVKGIFWTLNPVRSECLERSSNRIREKVSRYQGECTTADADIAERRLILIDIDPVRPAGISSTQEELDFAKRKARAVFDFLDGMGWERPLIGMSGNGFHLLYRVSLLNDSGTTTQIKSLLSALSEKFSDQTAKIDQAVYNAARICKVYGTTARKGEATKDRPFRRAMFWGQTGEL